MTSNRLKQPCARLFGAALALACLGGITFGAGLVAYRVPAVSGPEIAPGTLGHAMLTNLQSRLAGVTTNDLCAVNGLDPATTNTSTWSWNTNSPWFGMRGISGFVYQRAFPDGTNVTSLGGALISPRIIATCAHGGAGPGTLYFFMGTNGEPQQATVLASANLASHFWITDAQIGLLDRAMTNCEPLRVLPDDAADYLSSGVPILAMSGQTAEFKRLYVHRVSQMTAGVWLDAATNFPTLTRARAIGGDSGNPIVYALDDELIYSAAWFTGGGANWRAGHVLTATNLNAHMSNLCVAAGIPVEQLTVKDIGGYDPL